MQHYSLHRQFGQLLQAVGVELKDLLRKADLPDDFLSRKDLTLTQAEYFKMMEAWGELMQNEDGLQILATNLNIETMLPPIYAAYCSSDGLSFLSRIAEYKRLAIPMRIVLSDTGDKVDIALSAEDATQPLPAFFVEMAVSFTVGMLRKSTGVAISPLEVETEHLPTNTALTEWVGAKWKQGKQNRMLLLKSDLQLPFTSRNDAMWDYFEPELRRRLSEMEAEDNMAQRVRSVLIEQLPLGKSAIDDVAQRLYLSRRTLQRKLRDENTSFQQQLQQIRLLLTKNYLAANRSADEIAFLIGYNDTTAFLRAFSTWTGMSLSNYKKSLHETL